MGDIFRIIINKMAADRITTVKVTGINRLINIRIRYIFYAHQKTTNADFLIIMDNIALDGLFIGTIAFEDGAIEIKHSYGNPLLHNIMHDVEIYSAKEIVSVAFNELAGMCDVVLQQYRSTYGEYPAPSSEIDFLTNLYLHIIDERVLNDGRPRELVGHLYDYCVRYLP